MEEVQQTEEIRQTEKNQEGSNYQQLLTFCLGEENFGVPITQVIEVLEYQKITRVPRTPAYMKGVINVRGSVEPVVDIKEKFGMGSTTVGEETGIIIMELELAGETTQVGILTDAVKEVITIKRSDIEPAPQTGSRLQANYIKGVGKTQEGFIVILAVNKVFESESFFSPRESQS